MTNIHKYTYKRRIQIDISTPTHLSPWPITLHPPIATRSKKKERKNTNNDVFYKDHALSAVSSNYNHIDNARIFDFILIESTNRDVVVVVGRFDGDTKYCKQSCKGNCGCGCLDGVCALSIANGVISRVSVEIPNYGTVENTFDGFYRSPSFFREMVRVSSTQQQQQQNTITH